MSDSGFSGESDAPAPVPLHARPISAYEPDLPAFIPIARPVAPATPGYAPHQPRIGPWRALAELILLIPAGLFGSIVGFFVAHALGIRDERWEGLAATIGMGMGALAAAALLATLDGPRAPPIGWTPRDLGLNIWIGAGALLLTYVVATSIAWSLWLISPETIQRITEDNTATKAVRERIPDLPVREMAILMTFVAVWEEVVFRGFILTRLYALLRRWWLAIPLSALLFGSVHLYEGALAVGLISVFGVILALLFCWRRSLIPCITMHFMHNMLMLLLLKHGVVG
jgi:membrane protease YdiL (CAAX protease family)